MTKISMKKILFLRVVGKAETSCCIISEGFVHLARLESILAWLRTD